MYNIKIQVKFDLGYSPLNFLQNYGPFSICPFRFRSRTIARVYRSNSYLVYRCIIIVQKMKMIEEVWRRKLWYKMQLQNLRRIWLYVTIKSNMDHKRLRNYTVTYIFISCFCQARLWWVDIVATISVSVRSCVRQPCRGCNLWCIEGI